MDREQTLLFLEDRLNDAVDGQMISKEDKTQTAIHFWIGYETAIKTVIEYIRVCQS